MDMFELNVENDALKANKDALKAGVSKSKMEETMSGVKRNNTEYVKKEMLEWINPEQEKVIHKLEEVLNFLKGVQVKNEESLDHMKKPLDDLLCSLKYLPVEPSFSLLPTELKTDILSNLCDNSAFVAASVCQEWKDILQSRLKSLEKVSIGKHCSKGYKCECFDPEGLLKASINLQLDVPLSICHPVTGVDSELITEALTSVSSFSLNDDCDCGCKDEDTEYGYEPTLSGQQLAHLLAGLENKEKTWESIELIGLDLSHLDKDRVANCFLNKVKKIIVESDPQDYFSVMHLETMIRKLIHSLSASNLEELNLGRTCDYADELSNDLADALCTVSTVKLLPGFPLKTETARRLLYNILLRRTRVKCLDIDMIVDWRHLITPIGLRIVMSKMNYFSILGIFTSDQLVVARSTPNVEIIQTGNVFSIVKSSP